MRISDWSSDVCASDLDVRFKVEMNHSFFEIDSIEGPYNTGRSFETGNFAHRPGIKGGYFPVPPVDSAQDMRAEMVQVLSPMGLAMEKHHHEVAPSQHELGEIGRAACRERVCQCV